MSLNRYTAGGLAATLIVIFALSAYGDRLGLDEGTLEGVRTAAASLGAVVLASLGALLRKDSDGDGVPDILDSEDGK